MGDLSRALEVLAETRLAAVVAALRAAGYEVDDPMRTALRLAVADGISTGYELASLTAQRKAARRFAPSIN